MMYLALLLDARRLHLKLREREVALAKRAALRELNAMQEEAKARADNDVKRSLPVQSLHIEMCGIVGVACGKNEDSVAPLYNALLALQHRRQDAVGIVIEENGRLCLREDIGMVRDVFPPEHALNLRGDMGMGHVRYPTVGTPCSAEAQPFHVGSPYGITLAHIGNMVNADALNQELQRNGVTSTRGLIRRSC